MPYQRYSIREALNRFYRLWNGDTPPSDAPDSLPGSLFSEDEAWSNIAELFGGSLPGETLTLPASVADAISADQAHEYGEIYTSTGTVTMVIGTSEVKITGSFHVNGMSSANIAPDFDDDRIVINSVGAYFVPFQIAFSGTAATTFDIQVYLDGVAQPQIKTRRKLNAAGDVGSCSAAGMVNVTGTNMAVDIRILADGSSKNFQIEAAQLYVEKAPV